MSSLSRFVTSGITRVDGESLIEGPDGVYVADVTNAAVLPNGATTARSLADWAADAINVLDFGAKGDGATDDTAAIQSALDNASPNRVVYFPYGYTFMVDIINVPSGKVLHIDGTIKANPAQNGNNNNGICFTGSNSVITGSGTGIIDGNMTFQTGSNPSAGIFSVYSGIENIYVENITIQNFRNWPVNFTNVTNSTTRRCNLLNSGSSAQYAASSVNCWFEECFVSGINDLGVGLYGGVSGSGVVRCTVTNCQAAGPFVLLDSGQPGIPTDNQICENIVYGNSGQGIYVGSNLAGSIPKNITIRGNIVHNNQGVPINVNACNGLIVNENLLHDNPLNTSAADIFLEGGCSTGVVNGNTIINPQTGGTTGSAILCDLPNFLQISNNVCRDNQATPSMKYGISGNLGNNCSVTGNYYSGYITSADNLIYGFDSTSGLNTDANKASLIGSPLITGTPVFAGVILPSQTTGFFNYGLAISWNYSGGDGEVDFFLGNQGASGGANFYQVNGSGDVTGGPILKLQPNGSLISNGLLQIGGVSGPTWSTGNAAPTGTATNGSLYSNSSGTTGSTLYVYVAGAWKNLA
jgi:polygalacturonase